jgi:hypothetical protein
MTLDNQRIIAFALIAIGALAIVARVADNTGWLWVGLIAGGFLWAYLARKLYGLLVIGSILAGVAVGILLEGTWGWNGAFLISLGAGFFAIHQVEAKENPWPIYVAGILAGLGFVVGILESGLFTSIWFAILLIAVGIFLISRNTFKNAQSDTWTTFNPDSEQGNTKSNNTSKESVEQANNKAPSKPSTAQNEARANEVLAQKASPKTPPSETKVREIKANQATPSQTKQSRSKPLGAQESDVDPTLVSRLELWRRETARAEDKAAYLVLTNESLRLIAQNKPQTLTELKAIKGIGKVKLERYGDAILKLIKT